MREELGYLMKHVSDVGHKELSHEKIYEIFTKEYVNRKERIDLVDATFRKMPNSGSLGDGGMEVDAEIIVNGERKFFTGRGNGRIDAIRDVFRKNTGANVYHFVTYEEHALEGDSNSRAAAYVAISDEEGNIYWGVGIHNDIVYASINAFTSAINRGEAAKESLEK